MRAILWAVSVIFFRRIDIVFLQDKDLEFRDKRNEKIVDKFFQPESIAAEHFFLFSKIGDKIFPVFTESVSMQFMRIFE